jgi:hypothetical protein
MAAILGDPRWRLEAHELPTFPRVRVLTARADPLRPMSWSYTVEVLDPSGREPMAGANVRISGFERARGSRVRLESGWLAPTPTAGLYQGTIEFPGPGTWELTITVKGDFVGEAHTVAILGSGPTTYESPADRPQLEVDRVLFRHLLLEWGHLAGFGLWLGVTALALASRPANLKPLLVLTWIALAVEGGTGLYKMQVGTPFPRPLSIGGRDVPHIFFGREYVSTLVVKHLLMLVAIGVTGILTWQAWRSPVWRRTGARGLLGLNLALALAIAACVAVLDMLHAVVLHFS